MAFFDFDELEVQAPQAAQAPPPSDIKSVKLRAELQAAGGQAAQGKTVGWLLLCTRQLLGMYMIYMQIYIYALHLFVLSGSYCGLHVID